MLKTSQTTQTATQKTEPKQPKLHEEPVEPAPPPPTPLERVTARQLNKDYADNEIAADLKYKDKVFAVTGVVLDIGKDWLDDPYLTMGGRGILGGVHFEFNEESIPALARVSKGQSVTIKGEITGLTLGTVMVQECEIVK